jgi:2-alkyl-3-oxoalkanoate reductase
MALDRVLVTGGGGFIGQALVQALLDRGSRVTVLGRGAYPNLEALGVHCRRGDIRDPDALLSACKGQDTVFHVAALAGIWGSATEYAAINVGGTANVLRACRHNGVPVLVHTSTPSVVFAGASIAGGDETLPYARHPLCAYARTKIQAEQMVLADGDQDLLTTAIRPHLVWGPGDRNLIPRLMARGRSGQLRIVGRGDNLVDISYIDNVVHAHLLAAFNLHGSATAAGQAFFIGQKEPVALWPWINDLFRRLAIPEVRRAIPFALAYGVGGLLEGGYGLLGRQEEPRMTRFLAHQLAHHHWFSHERARQVLGYREQVDTETGLDRLVAWLTEQPAGN